MSFEVKIEVFEGPFDLLLQLIMKQELDIHEVPVARITDAFLEHVESAGRLDLETATEFLLIAATLLLIKARSLLPEAPEEAGEEREDPESERVFLVEKLAEYKKFSNAADWLEARYSEHGWYLPRKREMEEDYATLYPDPFEGVELSKLAGALVDLLAEWAMVGVDTTYIAPIRVSVTERMEAVRALLGAEGKTVFSELVAACSSRIEVIATFLAVLELAKRGEARLSQRRMFGEITITAREREESSAA